MQMRSIDRIILMMLADIIKSNGVESDFDPDFISEVVSGGHTWALEWRYPGVFGAPEDLPEVVQETSEILTMCRVLEDSINELGDAEKGNIPESKRLVFKGFDGNQDDHYGVAEILIGPLGRWDEFAERGLNSHATILPTYHAIQSRYQAEGGVEAAPFSLESIQKILNI